MKYLKKHLALLLTICMLINMMPMHAFATTDNTTVVIAGSDFQNPSGSTMGAQVVTNILTQIQNAGYTEADGFLFCGDYDYSSYSSKSSTEGGITALKNSVVGMFSMDDDRMILVEGNHDASDATGLASSGAHDTDEYGVYVINEDDYMWYNSDVSTISNTANALGEYLNTKLNEEYHKPIFVVSHLPLHYTMRTYNDGDGRYANYIFDKLNEAGEAGLNIIFLYGHDHSNGWDDYLGGSSVYLKKGDKINIAQASKTVFKEETLNFTYLNAGFTGYYDNHNGADDTLTMTVFLITDDHVQVERYDASGKHNLKSSGVTNSYKNESGYDPDTAIYESPQLIDLGSMTPSVTVNSGHVSVTAPGLTGLSATKNDIEYDTSEYQAYISYDIAPVGYTQGDKATVTITLDENDGFDASRKVIVIDQTGNNPDQIVSIINDQVTFTTHHFSTYDIVQRLTDELDGEWVNITENEYKTIFRLSDELVYGKNYLIVNSNQPGSANAIYLDGNNIKNNSITIIEDANGNYIDAPANTFQWTYTSDQYFQSVSNTQRYLRGDNKNKSLKTTNKTSDDQIIWVYDQNNGLSETTKNYYISSEFKMLENSSSSNRIYIYEEDTLQTAFAEYAKIRGNFEFTIAQDTSAEDVLALVKDGIDVIVSPDEATETRLEDNHENITWSLDSSYFGRPGEYDVSISYKDKELGIVKIIVPELLVTHLEVIPMEGTVLRGASNFDKTGSKLHVTYSDGSSKIVNVILNMLSGDFDKNTVGDYEGLKVTYGGKTVENYTLHVKDVIRVNKTGEGIDFTSSGIAKVELTASCLAAKKGADVIIMLDTSSSMTTTVSGSSKSRIQVVRESLVTLMQQFKAIGVDGQTQDIRIAVADFNGYANNSNSRYYQANEDHLSGASIRGYNDNIGQVYTGNNALDAGAFVDVNTLSDNAFDGITTYSGTNYDYAFDAIYQLGEAIQAQNELNGEDRDLFVIFMSDGAPFQYNYFSSYSGSANWNNWLQGSVTDEMWDSNAHNYFYNGSENKHRMAEAIKGNPDEMYTVIRKDSTDNYGEEQYMTQLAGLGATIYSLGFCLEQDNQITVESMEYVLKNISSDSENLYFNVNTASELKNAFSSIGNQISYAASNARFVDTMGANYDLQMKSSTYILNDGTEKTFTPEILVQAYDIYTDADGAAESEIGKRKGTSTLLETVTFNTDGTEAYSDKKSGNILIDGVICANTFWYNTTGYTVSIDTNGDDIHDYDLLPETFYWKMGIINQVELALSYYVYLSGSMEGEREAGSYPTNESAILYYTNWLGNEDHKDTQSPVLSWESAHVSYAFYLVNENGEIVVNKSTGETGSFDNKIAITNPIIYSEVLLNSTKNVQADILASSDLLESYTLYDQKAAYQIRVNSNCTGNWTITKGVDPATTYVSDYGNDPTNEITADSTSYDYTHTVVWFALTNAVKAVPDAIVIDYGLPVDIHVLKNDMFFDKGELQYVGAEKTDGNSFGEENSIFITNDFEGNYGTAKVFADEFVSEDSVIRYTPKDMQMNGVDKFSYAVNYTGDEFSGYYYGTVTVIPATTIYYEDGFVTYNDAKNIPEGNTTGIWTIDGTEQDGAIQDEDRPGSSSLSEIDANNLYGFDSHYTGFTTFSLGSAHKVSVDVTTGNASNAPEASFSFTGTGFDIISLTDNDSGIIAITIKDDTDKIVKRKIVDNYYGYKYDEVNGWVVDKNSTDTIWQVPVIKIEGLDYGTYHATIQVAYMTMFDHQEDGSYSFWLDAIRIYDPAKNDETANDTYQQDQEYAPQYFTLRDLLVSQDSLNVEGQTNGVVFIDGKDETSDINDYTNPGPNNETYLAYGQGVSFKLSSDIKPDSLKIGVKLAYGDAATLKFADKDFQTVRTATDMYYKLDDLNWTFDPDTNKYETDVITLSNSTKDAVISITNLKFTTDGSETAVTAFIDQETVEIAPMMMRALYGPVEEDEFFEPQMFTAEWKAGRINKWSQLTVTTSDDVEAVTVNGEEITTYKLKKEKINNKIIYKRVWNYKEKIQTAGTYYYEIIAYNSDGLESKPIETELTVSKR